MDGGKRVSITFPFLPLVFLYITRTEFYVTLGSRFSATLSSSAGSVLTVDIKVTCFSPYLGLIPVHAHHHQAHALLVALHFIEVVVMMVIRLLPCLA